MHVAWALLSAAIVSSSPGVRNVQNPPPAPSTSEQPAEADRVDPTKMGISLERIVRGLKFEESRERRTDSPFRIEYQVRVYGTAPRIDLLSGFDIGQRAPLQYGAPTHQEFLELWTPQAYRSPTVPFSSLAIWALGQLAQRGARSRCEQEIAEYRALVLQGVQVAAPRCAR